MAFFSFFALISFAIAKPAFAAGTWTVQTSGTTQNLMGVKFIDANTGWAVGGTSAPAILKTANGGTNWNAQSAPGPQNLMGVDAWDMNNALISGYGGVVNRTTNGGSNWSNVYYAGSGILRTIDYTDASTVYIGGTDNGNYARYIKSTNSGANWSGISSPGADNYAMRFIDANTGWATHATIQKTTNGGASWVNQLTFPGYLGMGMDVIDANTVYVVGQTGAGYGFVYKTTNGGISWNNITPGGANAPVYRAVDFVDANTGWIVGNNGTIYMTVDGGASWIQQTSGTINTLYGISAVDANTAWAVGINGTIVKYGGDINAPVYGSSSVSVSSQNWNPNGVNTYNITATVTETDSGFASAADGQHFAILTIINKDGENAGSSNTDPKDGGYFVWNPTGYDTGFTKNQMACTGAGGYAGMHAVVWGYDKNDLVGCGTTIISGTLQKGTVAVTWTVRPTIAMLELADNDISLYSQDVAGNTLGWINNQINFVTDRTSPVGGTVSNPNLSNSLFSVSVNPGVDFLSGMSTANADYLLETQSAVLSGGFCGAYGSFVDAEVNETYNATVYSFAGVSDNCYKFRYTVKDKAGNSATWVGLNATEVDLINPDTAISSVVDGDNVPIPNGGSTGSPDVTAIFFGIDNVGVVGYECSLDGSVYSSCVSPATYNSLALGFHTFNVQALDAAGNVDPTPASWNWTVADVTPPDTFIDSAVDGALAPIANGGSTGSDAATFAFSGTDNVAVTGFECSLDGTMFSACSSPVAYSALAVGAHSIQVRALDAAGNIDPTPAVWNWTVAPLSQAFFQVTFLRHRVQTGTNPGSVKEPVVGARVNVYNETPGSCAATIGVRPQNYEAILNNCVSDASGITDSAGKSSVGVIAGDYVLIAKDCLADGSCSAPYSGVATGKQGQIISAGQTINIPLQVIVRGNGTAVPAKTTVKTGSLLYIIEPEYIEWTNTQELYPFVFDAPDGAWDVTVSITPPEGFVADYQDLSTLVNNDYKVLQFTLTDIGSCWECGTDVVLTILHNGKIIKEKHHIDTAMSANFAKFKKLDIDDLKKKGVRIEN